MYYDFRPVPRLYIYDALGLNMNDPRFSNFKFQPSLVAQWIKAPVLVSDLHELKGSCPGFGEVSEDAQCVIANALQRSGGESELFNLCISEAKASPGWAPLTKIFFGRTSCSHRDSNPRHPCVNILTLSFVLRRISQYCH